MENKNIYQKLTIIQSELKSPKSQRNTFGNYNYRNCEDILEAVKPLLLENELVLIITDEIVFIQNNNPIQYEGIGKDKNGLTVVEIIEGSRFYVKATAILTDGEKEIKASAFAREEEHKKGMDASQLTGSTSSYARKYALNGLFCIDDTKDSDTTNTPDKQPLQPSNTATTQTTQENKTSDETCPACGNNLVLKLGKYGKFWSCTGYPQCQHKQKKYVYNPLDNKEKKEVDEDFEKELKDNGFYEDLPASYEAGEFYK